MPRRRTPMNACSGLTIFGTTDRMIGLMTKDLRPNTDLLGLLLT
jgi:hypothetical protein